MRIRSGLWAVLIVGTGLCPAAAEDSPGPPPLESAPSAGVPVFPAETEAVLLDIVVRDKKGRHVPDLQQHEVEIYEDGVRQDIVSFRRAEGAPTTLGPDPSAPLSSSGTTATSAAAAGPSRLVTLAFGRLGANSRRLAEKAGGDAVKILMTPGTFVEVLRLDPLPVQVQPSTSDPALVRQAVKSATASVTGTQAQSSSLESATSVDPGARGASRWHGLTGSLGSQTLEQSVGTDALHGLMSLIERVSPDPGRKTIVLFSEGMVIPPGRDHVFRAAISAANRANVSIYVVDVRGLDLGTSLSDAHSMLDQAARVSLTQRTSGSGDTPVSQAQVGQDDIAAAGLGANSLGILEELSQSTGGLLVTQTNDFSKGLAQIGADVHGYYEAVYHPVVESAPGQFHRIEVRVARKDVRVQSRSGYYTSPPAVEAPVADLLSAATLPREVETRSSLLRFGPTAGGIEHLLYLELPLVRVALREDATADRFRGNLVVVGRIKDESERAVDVFRHEFPVEGPLAQLEPVRGLSATFTRRWGLAPGQYTLEWLARDANADKTTAERRTIEVAPLDGGLAMSSLVVVSGVEPAAATDDSADPLNVGGSLLTPNLGQAIVPGPSRDTLAVYCVVYDKLGGETTPTATIELARAGQVIAKGSGPLPPPDAQGRTQYLSTIPIGKLTPGEYRVTVSVAKGQASAAETATVLIGS